MFANVLDLIVLIHRNNKLFFFCFNCFSELKGAAHKQKEHVGSDSGYEENGSNTSKSHILNIKIENASELKGLQKENFRKTPGREWLILKF